MGQTKPDEVTESAALRNALEDTGALLETITVYITGLNTAPLIAGAAHDSRVRAAREIQSSVQKLLTDMNSVMELYAATKSMFLSHVEQLAYEEAGEKTAKDLLRSKEHYEKRYTDHLRSYSF